MSTSSGENSLYLLVLLILFTDKYKFSWIVAGRKIKILSFVLDCQTRISEGVFEKKEQFSEGEGGLRKWNSEGMGGRAFWNFRRQGGGGGGKIGFLIYM